MFLFSQSNNNNKSTKLHFHTLALFFTKLAQGCFLYLNLNECCCFFREFVEVPKSSADQENSIHVD